MAEDKIPKQSTRARNDIKDILSFTRERWGRDKMLAYANEIDRTILMLCRHSEAGHTHPDLDSALRLFRVGSHIIVYRVEKTSVLIVRVLHGSMSLKKHL